MDEFGERTGPLGQEDILAWIRFHGIDPNEVARILIEPREAWAGCMTVEFHDLDEDGNRVFVPEEESVRTVCKTVQLFGLPGEEQTYCTQPTVWDSRLSPN